MSEDVPRCFCCQERGDELLKLELDVSDPFGLRKHVQQVSVLCEHREQVEAFVKQYNRRVPLVSRFLAAWFVMQNILFVAILTQIVSKETALSIFSFMVLALGVAYMLVPFAPFNLYQTYGISNAKGLVRMVALVMMILGGGLYFLK